MSARRQLQRPRNETPQPASQVDVDLAAVLDVFRELPDGMVALSPDLVIVAGNPALARQLGVPLADLVGRPARDVFRSWGAQLEPVVEAISRGDQPSRVVTITREPSRRSSKPIFWDVSVSSIVDKTGARAGCLLLWRDVTARERAANAQIARANDLVRQLHGLTEQLVLSSFREQDATQQAALKAAQLAALLESMHEGVAVVDPSGHVLVRNRRSREITGVTGDQLEDETGSAPARLLYLSGEPVSFDRWPMTRVLAGESFPDEEYVLERADRSRLRMLYSGTSIRDTQGQVALGLIVSRDITQLRELEQAQHEFVQLISHDLRNPLSLVDGYTQVVLQTPRLPEKARRSADHVLQAARRMNRLIQNLADSVRLESGQMRPSPIPVDLSQLVQKLTAEMVDLENDKRARVIEPDDLPLVLADPQFVERILANLLGNALRYSPPRVEVIVRLEPRDSDVVVSVTDRGPGIAPDNLPYIFERFYREKKLLHPGEGLGLGLHIAKLLVEAQGGAIWVESTVGAGTTFSFALPIAPDGA
jgi:PAS domain S-box-containing protein